MARSNCPRPEALLAYQDAALEPHRQAEVAAHLRECLACRRYLREGNELGNFLRQHITPIDDPEARARLTARLSAGSPPTSVSVASSTIGRRWLLTAGLALVAVLGLGLFSTGTIEGGSSFTRWLSGDSSAGQRRSATHIEQTPLTVPSVVQGDRRLPFGLRSTTQPVGQPAERIYRSPNGLAIAVLVDQTGESEIHLDRASGTTEIVAVNGREVYMTMTQTPVELAVISFDWVQTNRLVSVLVLEQPASGLTIEAAQAIAAAMMETVVE